MLPKGEGGIWENGTDGGRELSGDTMMYGACNGTFVMCWPEASADQKRPLTEGKGPL